MNTLLHQQIVMMHYVTYSDNIWFDLIHCTSVSARQRLQVLTVGLMFTAPYLP